MVKLYILALTPAIELNFKLVKTNPSMAIDIETMSLVYNHDSNREIITQNDYNFNKRINNLIIAKIKLNPDDYKQKLNRFKKNNNYQQTIKRLVFLTTHINEFKLLNSHCKELYKLSKQIYTNVYLDLL